MNERQTSDFIPALGYFGSSTADALVIKVHCAIRGIKIWLTNNEPEILNLMGMQILKDGAPVALDASAVSYRQSSLYQDEERFGNASLVEMKGIHSKHETHPSWQGIFNAPIDADAIRVFNRADEWGKRSKTLAVAVLLYPQGEWIKIHDSQSKESLLESFFAVFSLLDAGSINPSLGAHAVRENLIRSLSARILDGAFPLLTAEWQKIVHFVDLWGANSLSNEELTVIAAKIYVEKIHHGKSDVRDSAFVLRKSDDILKLQARVNEIARIYNDKNVLTISRHGLQHSKLQSKAEAYVSHLAAVVEILRDLEPVLAYGTLLGAIREQRFIAHDDDVDLLYRINALDRASAELVIENVFERLRSAGFEVVRFPTSLNAQVIDKKLDVGVDVFPCWDINGETFLHMESMQIRSISTNIMYPRKTIDFYGVELPVPNDPARFLQERYGDGWRISDQFFEWPWRLIDNTI